MELNKVSLNQRLCTIHTEGVNAKRGLGHPSVSLFNST